MPPSEENNVKYLSERVVGMAQDIHELKNIIVPLMTRTAIDSKEMREFMTDMKTVLRGRADDAKDNGLLGDVKDLRKWHESTHWLGRAMVTALLAMIFMILGGIFLELLKLPRP